MGSELSQEFLVQVSVHQGSVLSPLRFEIAVGVISENTRGLMNQILYADDLVVMSENIEELEREVFKMERNV